MKNQPSQSLDKIYFIRYLNTIMLSNEDNFIDSEWNELLQSIDEGFKKEVNQLNQLSENTDPRDYEFLGEGYSIALDISSNMFAALLVSVWAEIELLMKKYNNE